MKKMLRVIAAALLLGGAGFVATAQAASRKSIEHGEFLVGYGGCNDCHTPGWAMNNGQAPKEALLTGGGMNFQGPWGTTYAPNLRIYMQDITLKQWIHDARTLKARPAMPFWTFRYLSDKDLADIYAYVRSLGPGGQPAHDYVPPGQEAPAPFLKLVLPPPPPLAH